MYPINILRRALAPEKETKEAHVRTGMWITLIAFVTQLPAAVLALSPAHLTSHLLLHFFGSTGSNPTKGTSMTFAAR
jgi:hypothetical protein